MAKIFKQNLVLIVILFLATFLRVYNLNSAPPELFGDELDVGYQAYSVLKTGKDLQGNPLPTYFQSLTEARAPLFLYSAVSFVGIFGLNEWGVRLTAAFWGIFGILAIYLLTKKLFNSEILSFVSCLFLTISPWHLQYSRGGFEVTLLLSLLIFATHFFLEGLEKPKFLIPAAIFFALTPYAYSTGALFLPIFGLSLIVIFWKKVKGLFANNSARIAVLIFILILIPFVKIFFAGAATERFQAISVTLNPAIEKNVNEGRRLDKSFGAFFHNKPLSFLFETSRNYLWAFSPQFLFIDGDPNGRHSVGQMGEFYWFFLPLLLIGVYTLLRDKSTSFQTKSMIFSWLILAPVPTSLTHLGTGHATRLFLLLPPLIIFGAVGAKEILNNFSKSKVKILVVLIITIVGIFNLMTYFHRYYFHYPVESWRWWQVGYKEGMSFIAQNQNNYEKILINNTYEPALIRFLFYTKYDPAKFHQEFGDDKPQKQILPGFDGFSLENKFFFGTKTINFDQILDSKTLYLASHRDETSQTQDFRKSPPAGVKVLKTITNPFDEPIFYLLTGISQETNKNL